MTTTTEPLDKEARDAADKARAERDRASAARAAELVTRLLADRKPRLSKKKLAVAAAALGKALATTSPATPHGQLLARALRPAPGERPDDELAVYRLACKGETPTEAAVRAWLEGAGQRRERAHRLHERGVRVRAEAASIAAADGERTAAYVAQVVADTGSGPCWAELASAMEWPRQPWGLRNAIIRVLARDGWLATGTEPRSMRPGPRSETAVLASGQPS